MQIPGNPLSHRLFVGVLLAIGLAICLTIGLSYANYGPQSPHRVEQSRNTLGPVDAGFVRSMLLHHAQAIQMAMFMRTNTSPEIQALAHSIVMKQTHEMGLMEGWLTAWNSPVMVDGPPMRWVEEATHLKHLDDQLFQARCKADGGAMAGAATPQQLEQLEKSSAHAKEKLFLELMIAHHQAALSMAWFTQRNGHSNLVKGLANSMIREQGTEIGWMQMKLKQLDNS
ncbi:DUF305 domain-containing protein [Limnobacter sp.]|uniref:DUF305 domain-containing protein n=1 Tax=Limnobacter sp. TaxID=2003368 RepID=UPI0027376FCD|nr:DUF305 domain-containing protein [Limnobacter sp.]MDP3188836.1 DUF305 domain-containing protein [Limnobacter sp.]